MVKIINMKLMFSLLNFSALHHRFLSRLVILFLGIALIFPIHAMAGETAWSDTPHAKLRIVTAGLGAMPSEPTEAYWLGVDFSAEPGWKLYWRTPGDAGFPPSLAWDGLKNIKQFNIAWPSPKRSIESAEGIEIESFTYEGKFLLPLMVVPHNKKEGVSGKVSIQYAACKDICIPLFASFDITVSSEEKDPTQWERIQTALTKVPQPNGTEGLKITGAKYFSAPNGEHYIEAEATSSSGFSTNPDLFVESEASFQFRQPKVTFSEQNRKAQFLIQAIPLTADLGIQQQDMLRLTLVDAEKAVETTVNGLTANPMPVSTESLVKQWLVIIGLALLGGLILNIMPCVLPVLSMKILSVLKHGGGYGHHVRSSFLASAAGIISSFFVIGVVTVLLKAGGKTVGWGFHFQDPPFLIALVVILVLFAANLAGRFEIRLPTWLSDTVLKMEPHHHNLTGDFLTGVLATILATPCTAPFLGTAISFALSRGTAEILIIFTLMGLGLALPYLACAMVPRFATRLPKPGMWMVRVKYGLAVLLALTALWLLWILSHTLGIKAATAVFLATLLVKFAIEQQYPLLRHGLVRALLVVCTLAIAFAVPLNVAERDRKQQESIMEMWQPFDENAISPLVSSGKVVFVDVTADWCLTCKFNKIFVLDRPDTMLAFKRLGIVAMRADITVPNQAVLDYLERHGRYGIPFNIVYGPGAPDGVLLGELLSSKDVMAAIHKAAGQ